MDLDPHPTTAGPTRLPTARGELGDHPSSALLEPPPGVVSAPGDPTDDEDAATALLVLQEMSFRRIEGVDPAGEDDIGLLSLRHRLDSCSAGSRTTTPTRPRTPSSAPPGSSSSKQTSPSTC